MQKFHSLLIAAGFALVMAPAIAFAQETTFATDAAPKPVPQSESGGPASGFSGSSGTTAPAGAPAATANATPAIVPLTGPLAAPAAPAAPQVAAPAVPALDSSPGDREGSEPLPDIWPPGSG